MAAIRRQAFDREDRFSGRRRNRSLAGTHHLAVEMHGACAALAQSTTELRTGQADVFTQHPQQRGRWIDVHALRLPIDREGYHHHPPPIWGFYAKLKRLDKPRITRITRIKGFQSVKSV